MAGVQGPAPRQLRAAGRLVVVQAFVFCFAVLLTYVVRQIPQIFVREFAEAQYPVTIVLLVFSLAILIWCIYLVPTPGGDCDVPLLPGVQILVVGLVFLFLDDSGLTRPTFFWLHGSLVVVVLYSFRLAVPLLWSFGLAHLVGNVVMGSEFLLIASALPLLTGASYLGGRLIHEHQTRGEMLDQARWAASEFAKINERLSSKISFSEIRARSQERLRLARQIHDTIGYTLTGVLLQLSAVREQIYSSPKLADERVESLQDAMRIALNDVRAEVSSIREEAEGIESWKAQWSNVCRNFSLATAVRIHENIDESIPELPDEVGSNVYHILQEALTNAYRHGRATFVDVSIGIHAGKLLVRVSDDGVGAEQIDLGNGLRGIRERVDALGGDVAYQTSADRGFDLGISVPLSEPAS